MLGSAFFFTSLQLEFSGTDDVLCYPYWFFLLACLLRDGDVFLFRFFFFFLFGVLTFWHLRWGWKGKRERNNVFTFCAFYSGNEMHMLETDESDCNYWSNLKSTSVSYRVTY